MGAQNVRPDVVALLDDHADRGDTMAILQACNTLNGLGGVLFGVPINQVSNTPELQAKARQALERSLARVPIEQADAVIFALSRASVGVDLAALRERLATAASRARPAIEAHLRRTTDVAELIVACETLDRGGRVGGEFFGRSWPGRDTLRTLACERLVGTIAQLPPAQARAAIVAVRRSGITIDLGAVVGAVTHVDTDEPMNEDIEAAIDASPDDPENFAVLGDWLAERGHVRGELIALQLRAESDPELADTANAYAREHAAELLGVLAEIDVQPVWRRGFISEVTLFAHGDIFLAEQVAAVLDHPSGRRLRTLQLVPDDDDSTMLSAAIELAVDREPRQLRHLVLGDTDLSRFASVDLASLWRGLPRLSSLIVRGRFSPGTPIEHVGLVRVQFETVALSSEEAQRIATAKWPQIEHLDVWFGNEGYDEEENLGATLADAIAILARKDLPALSHLGLMNARFTDEICEALATAPLAAQLVELDLAHGTMSRAGADALIRVAPKLPKLVTLDVSANYLDEPTLARLRSTFRVVLDTGQRVDDGDERYPAVIE